MSSTKAQCGATATVEVENNQSLIPFCSTHEVRIRVNAGAQAVSVSSIVLRLEQGFTIVSNGDFNFSNTNTGAGLAVATLNTSNVSIVANSTKIFRFKIKAGIIEGYPHTPGVPVINQLISIRADLSYVFLAGCNLPVSILRHNNDDNNIYLFPQKTERVYKGNVTRNIDAVTNVDSKEGIYVEAGTLVINRNFALSTTATNGRFEHIALGRNAKIVVPNGVTFSNNSILI